jgi:hypothetical protein
MRTAACPRGEHAQGRERNGDPAPSRLEVRAELTGRR